MYFKHQNKYNNPGRKATFCVETVPDKETLFGLVKDTPGGGVLLVRAGVALVHPNDPYVKAVGRATAEKKLNWMALELSHVTNRAGKLIFSFRSKEPVQALRHFTIAYSISQKSENVRIEYTSI